MIDIVRPQLSHDMQALWQDVLSDLRDVFDLHYVCARFSSIIARNLESRVLVALADDETRVYNLWISDIEGLSRQDRWSRNEAGIDPLLSDVRPTILNKLDRPAAEVLSGRLWLEARRRLIVAPIMQGDRPYAPHPPALLALIDPPEEEPVSLQTVEQIADLLHVFLDRAGLRQAVDRQTVEFAVISDINQALSSTLNIQEIYELLTGPILQTLNVETLSIGLVEPITGDIVFVENLLGPMFERLPPIRLKRGQGIAGWVVEHQEPVTINNAYSDRRFFSDIDRSSGFRTRSMICIPLIVDDRTIGILQAINRQFGQFTEHDLQLIQGLGGPLAAAIENTGLHAEVLAESRRIETLFDTIADGLVTINRDGIISRANSAFATLLNEGEEGESLIGSPLRERVRAGRGEIDSLVAQVFDASTGDLQWVVDMAQTGGRMIPITVGGAAVRNADGGADEAVLIFSDLTQIREVERMRDDLFQGIIDELRTPLATILMYSRLLREGKARQPDKAERFLGVIERESDRLQRMIRQMLDLEKLEAREIRRGPTTVMLNPILNEVLPPMAERAVQKGLLFRQRIGSDLPPVTGNVKVLKMVLENLLENAIKFSPSGNVQVSAGQEDGLVAIEISDEGIGIPAEAMNSLFKRFYRTQTAVDRGLAGTGLGLYMVKEGLRNYNGQITVQSTLGKGSVFTVRLPIAQV